MTHHDVYNLSNYAFIVCLLHFKKFGSVVLSDLYRKRHFYNLISFLSYILCFLFTVSAVSLQVEPTLPPPYEELAPPPYCLQQQQSQIETNKNKIRHNNFPVEPPPEYSAVPKVDALV